MSGAKKSCVEPVTKFFFAVLLKFHHICGHAAVPRAIESFYSMHNKGCVPHWAYIAIKGTNGYNKDFLAPPVQLCYNKALL